LTSGSETRQSHNSGLTSGSETRQSHNSGLTSGSECQNLICAQHYQQSTMDYRGALFSDDNRSRYRLWRIWDSSKPCILFIMLNPSTADKEKDDPTIKIIQQHATAWGFGGIYVGNLYATCCSKSCNLSAMYERDMTNESHIEEMMRLCSKVVYGWGTKGPQGKKQKEPQWLYDMVPDTAYCMDMTKKERVPKHPKQHPQYTLEIRPEPTIFRTKAKSKLD